MSTKREPLLSDAEKETMCGDLLNAEQVSKYALGEAVGRRRGVELGREFYEDLITTGKLRVVEEVKYSDLPGLMRNCSKCDQLSEAISAKYYVYCPGCGNKIKR